jgi:hypothetical protein
MPEDDRAGVIAVVVRAAADERKRSEGQRTPSPGSWRASGGRKGRHA